MSVSQFILSFGIDANLMNTRLAQILTASWIKCTVQTLGLKMSMKSLAKAFEHKAEMEIFALK